MTTSRICAHCGKPVTQGYVWDDTDTFCSEDCAAQVFTNPFTGKPGDTGCVEILIDEGRMVWKEF